MSGKLIGDNSAAVRCISVLIGISADQHFITLFADDFQHPIYQRLAMQVLQALVTADARTQAAGKYDRADSRQISRQCAT